MSDAEHPEPPPEPSEARNRLVGLLSTVVAGVSTPATVVLDLVGTGAEQGAELLGQVQGVLNETALTLSALRQVLEQIAEAMNDGLLDDFAEGMARFPEVVELMERMSKQVDHALPVLDATAPTLGRVNSTLKQLDTTIAQLETLPGVRMARRFVSRPVSDPARPPALPEAHEVDPLD